MAMTHLQFALASLAEKLSEASVIAQKAQQFGLDFVDPNDPEKKTLATCLSKAFRAVHAAQCFVEEQSRGQFEFVPDTIRGLNGMDALKFRMGYAIEAGHVENFEDEEDEDE